jgi:hypothetical protein
MKDRFTFVICTLDDDIFERFLGIAGSGPDNQVFRAIGKDV